jgi:hypothetical protein
MTQKEKVKDERMFTIELKSNSAVKNISLDGSDEVLIEGSIGTLKSARFLDEIVLEVIGSKGVIRIDLTKGDIRDTVKVEGAEIRRLAQ